MAEKCFSVIQLLLITFSCVFGLVHDVGAGTLYFATGKNLILNPGITGIPTDILWKHEGHKAVESNPVYREYSEFKGKTTLNITTGELTVRGLTKSFSGSYQAECTIQGVDVPFTQRIEVLDPVSQPVVSCVQTSETTTLRCLAQGDLLQYRWSGPGLEGATWREEETGSILNTTSETGNYTCMVKNPVSEERKDFNTRDCGSEGTTQGIVAGIVVGFICLVIAVTVGLFCYFKKQAKGKHSGDSEHGDHQTQTNTVPEFDTNGLQSSPDVSLFSSGEQKEKIQTNVQEGSEQDESQPLLQEPNQANDEEVDEDPVNVSVYEKARMFEKRVSLRKDDSGQLTGEREKTHPKTHKGETKGKKLAQDPPAPGDMKTPPPSSSKGKHSGDSEHGDHPTQTNTVPVFGTDGLRSSPDTPASTVYTSERETADQAADVSLLPAPERKEKIQTNVQEGSEQDASQPLLQEPNQASDEEVDEDPLNISVYEKARMFEKLVSLKDDSGQLTGEREKTLPKRNEGETKGEKLTQDPPAPGDMKTLQVDVKEGSEQDESLLQELEPNQANDEDVDPGPFNRSLIHGRTRMFEKWMKDESAQLTDEREKTLPKRNEGETKGEKLTQDPPAPGDMKTLQVDVQEGSEQDASQPLLQEPNRASDEEVDTSPFNRRLIHLRTRMFEKWMKDESGQLTDEREKTLPKTCEGGTKGEMPAQDPPAPGDTKTLPEEPPVSSGAVGQNPPMSVEVGADTLYFATGKNLILNPGITGIPTYILWKHEGDKAVESNPVYREYRQFKDKTKLNITTGELTVRGLTKNFTGSYRAECIIQGEEVLFTQIIQVLDPVSKPVVTCVQTSETTTLRCLAQGDLLQYRWSGPGLEGATWREEETGFILNTTAETGNYTCMVKNPATIVVTLNMVTIQHRPTQSQCLVLMASGPALTLLPPLFTPQRGKQLTRRLTSVYFLLLSERRRCRPTYRKGTNKMNHNHYCKNQTGPTMKTWTRTPSTFLFLRWFECSRSGYHSGKMRADN
ncbi:uncharacterized protein ACJ7VT_020109 [Polymixia lowei]